MIGLTVLERTGVTAYRGERMQLPETTASESGYQRQARLVASVLLEGREHVKPELGPEIEKVLAQDARKCAEAVNTCRAKLSRSCATRTIAIRHWKPTLSSKQPGRTN
jgi:hypothetical protein